MLTNLNESAGANRQNNTRELTVTIQPKLVTQPIDRVTAKEAGAHFSVTKDGPALCVVMSSGGDSSSQNKNDEIWFWVDCSKGVKILTGVKANFEAYANFNLKNGWKVKSYQIVNPEIFRGGWNWVTTPANGSTSPHAKLHLWSDFGGKVRVTLKVLIEGPEGTNPYQ